MTGVLVNPIPLTSRLRARRGDQAGVAVGLDLRLIRRDGQSRAKALKTRSATLIMAMITAI
jgi:hypothetical protein